jgi:hypothetical protein
MKNTKPIKAAKKYEYRSTNMRWDLDEYARLVSCGKKNGFRNPTTFLKFFIASHLLAVPKS